MGNPQNFRGGSGGDQKPRRMEQRDGMLRSFVSPDGKLNVGRAQGFLDVIGDNLLHINNLSGSNISLVFSQRTQMHWPIFSKAAREAGLALLPEAKGKGAWILIPRDQESLNEMKKGSNRDPLAATREAVLESANLVEEISRDMRSAGEAALDEKNHVATQMRDALRGPRSPESAARVAELKVNLVRCDHTAADSFHAADNLGSQANLLREAVENGQANPKDLAKAASVASAALVDFAAESDAVNAAHEALGRAERAGNSEHKRCTGKVVQFDQVRCVYDLERDFVKNGAWETVMEARRNPVVDAADNAVGVAACLRARNAAPAGGGATAARLMGLTFALVRAVGADENVKASKAAQVFATYFVARALGAPRATMPAYKLEPGKDQEEVGPPQVMAVLRESITLSRTVLAEIIQTRSESETLNVSAETNEAQAATVSTIAPLASSVDGYEESVAVSGPALAVPGRGARR